jgi:hypothetical protein
MVFGVFYLSLSIQPISAKEKGSSEVALLANYMQEILVVYNELYKVIDISIEVDDLAYSIAYEEVDRNQVIESARSKLSTANQIIKKVKNHILCCLKKPIVRSKGFLIIINSTSNYIINLPKQASDLVSESALSLESVLAGDFDTYDEIQSKQLDRMELLLTGENIMAQSQQLALSDDSPGYWYLECIIIANNALINIVKSLNEIIDNKYFEKDIVAAQFVSENYLVNLSNAINNGKDTTRIFFNKLLKYPAKNKLQKRQKLIIVKVSESFKNSFVIENNIKDLLQELSALVLRKDIINAMESPAVQSDLGKFDELAIDVLPNLVDLRLMLASERIELLKELGGG